MLPTDAAQQIGWRRAWRFARCSACLAALAACATTQQAAYSSPEEVRPTPRAKRPRLALQLLDAQHRSLPVVADGEQATLLFFFATYDGVSQAALTPLRQLHSRCAQLRIVGIALQPDPGPLLEAWQAALQPPFALGYDPSGALLDGHSALGSFAVIPAYVLFERQGEQAARFDGYASERRLLALLQPLGACDVAVHDADR